MILLKNHIHKQWLIRITAVLIVFSFGLLIADSLGKAFGPMAALEVHIDFSNDAESSEENEESKEENKLDDFNHDLFNESSMSQKELNIYLSPKYTIAGCMREVITPPPQLS